MSIEAVIVAALFSVAVEFFLDITRREKASLLDPIEALRLNEVSGRRFQDGNENKRQMAHLGGRGCRRRTVCGVQPEPQ